MGAPKLTTTISRKSASPAIATRLRTSRRPASAHGLRPATSGPPGEAGSTCSRAATSAMYQSPYQPGAGRFRGTSPPPGSDSTGLLDPELVDQDVPLRVPLVVPDPLRQEVDLLGVVEVDPRSLIGHLVVNLRPDLVRGVGVGDAGLLRLIHLGLDRLVAEGRDVRAGVAVRVDGAAAEEHVQEVGRRRVVLVPGRPADVPLAVVLRVLHVRVLDAVGQVLTRRLVPDLVHVGDHLLAERLRGLVVAAVDDDLGAGG